MKDCNNCANHQQGKHPSEVVVDLVRDRTCKDCLEGGTNIRTLSPELPYWKPKDASAAAEEGVIPIFLVDPSGKNAPVKLDKSFGSVTQAAPGAAIRANGGKPPLALVPRELDEGCARGFGYGKDKYTKITGKDATHNWKAGLSFLDTLSSALRHLKAYGDGENLDPESGLCHLDLASCNLAMLQWMRAHKPQFDDRYKEETK